MSTQLAANKHQVKLVKRFAVADRTMAFQFEKPSSFVFRPGQYIEVTLLNPRETDAEGNARVFSLANAPHEDFVMVATRLRDTAFKRELQQMPLGAEVVVEGPSGGLTLHNNAGRAAIFLVGGIGVTPVRSILLRAAHERLAHRLFVFYSNRRPEDAAFLDELTALQDENPNYKLIPTMTAAPELTSTWQGERGHITSAMLAKHVGDAASPVYYVVGPPGMVNGARDMLNRAGVDDDDIRLEDFGGY